MPFCTPVAWPSKKTLSTTFENVNLYNLFAEILKLKPAANDDNTENVKQMLLTD
ncbi:hypothetical protein [Maribellus mangrovi]|uniref:hypothetical protein n=1 Tax=Maribellus mangrovi TaxID=3133146 RepID=UPI0030EEF9BE